MILNIDPKKWPKDEYDVLLADPPWKYEGDPNKDQAAGKHYKMMEPEEMAALPVKSVMRKQHSVLFLWATSPKLHLAMQLLDEWELHYRGVAFVWVKTRQDGVTIIGAQGVRPSIVKPTTEFLLAASPQASGRPLRLASESITQVTLAPRPGEIHSKKPDVFQEKIEQLFQPKIESKSRYMGEPPVVRSIRRLEMFARGEGRKGWDSWGLEAK